MLVMEKFTSLALVAEYLTARDLESTKNSILYLFILATLPYGNSNTLHTLPRARTLYVHAKVYNQLGSR
jgi:hypothetical protein